MTPRAATDHEITPTLLERLTADFYAWERRGRGWQVWEQPIELEPPFRPFYFPSLELPPSTDDGRRHTFLSALVERVLAPASAPPNRSAGDLEEAPWEPVPEPWSQRGSLSELQVSLQPGTKVSREATEGLLLSLSSVSAPLGFEVLGFGEGTWIQLLARSDDVPALRQQLLAHVPEAGVTEEPGLRDRWNAHGPGESVVVDFGLSHEFMLPLQTSQASGIDPLVGVVGVLDGLQERELGVLQVLFQPVRHRWAEQILRSVSEMESSHVLPLAKEKVSRPLFAAVLRVGARSQTEGRAWEIARQLGGVLRQYARPSSNELIPLSDADYPTDAHEDDFLERRSRRSGMLLNLSELVSLVHLPSPAVRSERLRRERRATREAPALTKGPGLVLGENDYRGRTVDVHLPAGHRLRHVHILGATGTGKSHLLLNLIQQDIENGEGIGVLDPHGDLIDRILERIPEGRQGDVVLLDPADEDFPVAFNILSAHSELERNLLASDLVAAFRRLATSWGDQMTSVLRNAVLAFLESDEGGTLADLRRFLVEPAFRTSFLQTVRDEEVVYFWQKEFPLLSGRPQAPLLTRLDSFLAPKPLRRMVSQRESRLDFGEMMDGGQIFLARLSQGAIGEENAHLLGSLLAAKFQQLAAARQARPEAERRPFFLYVDEFQHFATPSMAQILGGARKYGLGLTLAHQDLAQLDQAGSGLASAVLSNPATRICFRVGDSDARKLAEGFASFEAKDLSGLGRGEAVCRVERSDWSFNLRTMSLPALDTTDGERRAAAVVRSSRERYGTARKPVEGITKATHRVVPIPQDGQKEAEDPSIKIPVPGKSEEPGGRHRGTLDGLRRRAPPVRADRPKLGKGGPEHTELQDRVKRWAGGRGWLVTIEEPVLDGRGRVDVALRRGEWTVACEISVSSSAKDELGNVRKCLEAGFDEVVVLYSSRTRLRNGAEQIRDALSEGDVNRVLFLTAEDLWQHLEEREASRSGGHRTVAGWSVKTRYQTVSPDEQERQTTGVVRALRRIWSKEG